MVVVRIFSRALEGGLNAGQDGGGRDVLRRVYTGWEHGAKAQVLVDKREGKYQPGWCPFERLVDRRRQFLAVLAGWGRFRCVRVKSRGQHAGGKHSRSLQKGSTIYFRPSRSPVWLVSETCGSPDSTSYTASRRCHNSTDEAVRGGARKLVGKVTGIS